MAIAPTPNNSLFKGLMFDGIDSRDFGIYITGEAVFNAPERDVEMIEIPGRNGAFALDKGRFSNITVTYPAGMFGDTEADFAQGISDLRNALASRKGYCRLEDEYNPDEYRMAVYRSGLEVTPAQLKAGEFNITFDCQPQRYLKSGQSEIAVSDGGTVTNPTYFDAHPLLRVKGYGDINSNGDRITIHNEPYGLVQLLAAMTSSRESLQLNSNAALLNTGDTINVSSGNSLVFQVWSNDNTMEVTRASATVGGDIPGTATTGDPFTNFVSIDLDGFALTNGTSATKTITANTTINYTANGSQKTTSTVLTFAYEYDGDSQTVSMYHVSTSPALPAGLYIKLPTFKDYAQIIGNSTKLLISDWLYIDLDLGAAYYITESGPVSINNIIELPSELPALKPGANTINYSNTFRSVFVTPRWWIV